MKLLDEVRHVLCGGGDKVLRLWDAATGREVWRQEGLTAGMMYVAVSADGRHGLSASDDLTVRLWRLPAPTAAPAVAPPPR